MRNSHPVTCESPSGIELSDVKEEQEFGCMDTKTVKAHLGRVREATVKVRAGLGGMKVYRVMGKRDQRHSCFREVEGLCPAGHRPPLPVLFPDCVHSRTSPMGRLLCSLVLGN